MKKKLIILPTIALLSAISIPTISWITNTKSINKVDNKIAFAQTNANNYSVITPSWIHYAIGEQLDLRDLKVIYNDPEKGAIDVTNECKLNMQNDQELTKAGEFDVTIQHNDFNTSFKIHVENEAHEIPTSDNTEVFGKINVKFKLMSNQECIFTSYESGEGNLIIPDYIEHDGVKYFIKQIPSNWSDGENDITGLEFKCTHLKNICDNAFEGTNCLDYYINHKDELLEFPEGLEVIGKHAFANTDLGQNTIKGYSFPSTLKTIAEEAFYRAPYIDGDNIDGDNDNGELCFKSIPIVNNTAFKILYPNKIVSYFFHPQHNCKYIYGSTEEIAKTMANKIRENLSDFFQTGEEYLIPKLKI